MKKSASSQKVVNALRHMSEAVLRPQEEFEQVSSVPFLDESEEENENYNDLKIIHPFCERARRKCGHYGNDKLQSGRVSHPLEYVLQVFTAEVKCWTREEMIKFTKRCPLHELLFFQSWRGLGLPITDVQNQESNL